MAGLFLLPGEHRRGPATLRAAPASGGRSAPLGQLAAERGKDVSTHLFGQEINAETYAI